MSDLCRRWYLNSFRIVFEVTQRSSSKMAQFSNINIRMLTNLRTAGHWGGGRGAGAVRELPLPVSEDQEAPILIGRVLDVLHVKLQAQVQPGDGAWITGVTGLVPHTVRTITGYFGRNHGLRQTRIIFASFRRTVRCAVVIFKGGIFRACLALMTETKFYFLFKVTPCFQQ